MKYFYDCEFLELGPAHPIYLLSIGVVSEDGRELYLQNKSAPFQLASDWVKENVYPAMEDWHQRGEPRSAPTSPRLKWLPDMSAIVWQSRQGIANQLRVFIGDGFTGKADKPEFYGWYSSYDHVVLCQLFGAMIDLPKGWPMFTIDLKQWCHQMGDPKVPEQGPGAHNALEDARYNKRIYDFLRRYELDKAFDSRTLAIQGERR